MFAHALPLSLTAFRPWLALGAAMSLALGGCLSNSNSDSPQTASGTNSNGAPVTTAQAQAVSSDPALGTGCGWQAASDVDKANVAFPDQAARYWVALIPMTPQTRLRIDGVFPDARYFSFNAYDPLLRPTDAIADYQLKVPGNLNPFAVAGAQSQTGTGRYSAYLMPGAVPKQKATNAFYAGDVSVGPAAVPNALLVPVIYRTYVSTPKDPLQKGNVPLPMLTLETLDGSRTLGTLPTCTEPVLPSLNGKLPAFGLNAQLLKMDYPDALALDFPTASNPPKSPVFYGLPDSVVNIAGNLLGRPLSSPNTPLTSGGGFLSNKDNAYTSTGFSRKYGAVFVLRARAPRWRSAPGVPFGAEQVRYWSICQNEFVTQRYTACSYDAQTPVDSEGFFTVVVSDEADRPSNATAAQGYTWLPWGPYVDGLLIYRHMLPSPQFAQAIQNVPKGTAPQQVMQDYHPVASYCTRAVFEASATPKGALAACQKATQP